MATADESVLDPEVPICDAHHHLWDHRGLYLAEEFEADISSGHDVRSTVFVECGARYFTVGPKTLRPVGETLFVDAIAGRSAARARPPCIAAGIVAYADLSLGSAVAEVLERHHAASPHRLRGIRYSLTWDEEPAARGAALHAGMVNSPAVRDGLACLERFGLSFDAWLFHPQLSGLVPIAASLPRLPIVLNHLGGPLGVGRYKVNRVEVFAEWYRAMSALAALPNVYVKLGGFGMPRLGFGWHDNRNRPSSSDVAAAIRDWCLACIELFGSERCMFESNFPPDKDSFSYLVAWNAYKRVVSGCSVSERRDLFHDTACRVYRLPSSKQAN